VAQVEALRRCVALPFGVALVGAGGAVAAVCGAEVDTVRGLVQLGQLSAAAAKLEDVRKRAAMARITAAKTVRMRMF
jgi:hypothetical protein